MLQNYIHKHPLDWLWFFTLVGLYYNATKQNSIGKLPHVTVYGHDVLLPADLMAPTDATMIFFVELRTETKQVIEVS